MYIIYNNTTHRLYYIICYYNIITDSHSSFLLYHTEQQSARAIGTEGERRERGRDRFQERPSNFRRDRAPIPPIRPRLSSTKSLFRREEKKRRVRMGGKEEVKHLEDCTVFNALGTWIFSVGGALLAIPVGIKRKSLAPLVFFGTTGTMLDIIMGISACEREHAERQMKLQEEQSSTADASFSEAKTDS